MALNFDDFPNFACILFVNVGDELSVLPHDGMLVLCIFDNGSLFPLARSAI